ncbi:MULTISPECIES: alpha-1,4-glucan--maltose-1-phosphate maltosyltransferase [unclassified Arcicella]|uniref:alpha-1,4-glucan--maltose-1-phosphate maltosyltransferase n=1 Tax=unclassified Arcicella TaxID=2644986 RepID=UPI002858109E|nr:MULTISPECIES: alpha-1,4-glucan--maltose-1-phosphate maltosyltransferase [unclassified Arcicella]MDR6561704.1 starch synthase (maltosyl-transferring) [Arcicella sp. BE51]MDR6812484.1 starch synthase (maltosyl-transferring) [Arcicella sp. BE140]MDR6823744.1 starch synthase (maltosyl-transferring) [Arcicella sp. BE139]
MISKTIQGQQRVIIENISPQLDAGRYAIKAFEGDTIKVEADIFLDGHDQLAAKLLYKFSTDEDWIETTMNFVNNDHYEASFQVSKNGFYTYTIQAWVDNAATWHHEIDMKIKDGQHVNIELLVGANIIEKMMKIASKEDKAELKAIANLFKDSNTYNEAIAFIYNHKLHEWIEKYPDRQHATIHRHLKVWVDREKAAFSAWYSMFPRSASVKKGQHGTFKDVEENVLPRLKSLGFDVLYIPPIHPIGKQFRKGKNNSTTCQEGEPGVPYGIGSELGGHTAILPELGTLDDLKHLIGACKEMGIELAMDLAIQCSPDHPWAKEHPEWFKIRPDGTIQYAENPPKKYQDIYPINFETENWKELWEELKSIIMTWADWGVRILRIDNPHTKPFAFWEWVIAEVQAVHPDMIFLAEAFTKPKVMAELAKLGYTQSYTYYTWRNSKAELIGYMNELTQTEQKQYMRPNFWTNTHDILPWALQTGLEPLFIIRYFMAATLSSNYGIFGPVFEYMISEANPNKEEYKNSEKYEIKHWNWEMENKLTYIIRQTNHARIENSALQRTNNITFCDIQNDQILAYLKTHSNGNRILCIVNLDGHNRQGGTVRIPLNLIQKYPDQEYIVHDLITGAKYVWRGEYNYIDLDPHVMPMHLFRIEDIYY